MKTLTKFLKIYFFLIATFTVSVLLFVIVPRGVSYPSDFIVSISILSVPIAIFVYFLIIKTLFFTRSKK